MFGRKKKTAAQTAAERVRERHNNPPRPEQYRTIKEYRDAEDAFTSEGLCSEGVEYHVLKLACSGIIPGRE